MRIRNKITLELDKMVKDSKSISGFYNYIHDEAIDGKWIIRYLGASRGYVETNSENVITKIVIYDGVTNIYSKGIDKAISKFIGTNFEGLQQK